MGDFTKDELAKIKAKEAGWKAEGDKKAKAADDVLVNKFKNMIGMGDDFEPRMTSNGDTDVVDMSAVRSPVSGTGQDIRSPNMGMRSKSPKPSDMKKGGKVKASSASKRADGIASKGKTRGRIC